MQRVIPLAKNRENLVAVKRSADVFEFVEISYQLVSHWTLGEQGGCVADGARCSNHEGQPEAIVSCQFGSLLFSLIGSPHSTRAYNSVASFIASKPRRSTKERNFQQIIYTFGLLATDFWPQRLFVCDACVH